MRDDTIKVGQTVTYKTAGITSSGRVVRVGASTVDIAGPGPARGRGTHGPIQFARGGVTTILKSDIVREPPSLAAAARSAGYEPETEEGGRAMMQAITPEHLHRAEGVRKLRTLKPGDEIEYTNFTVGGSYKGQAIVTWDHGKSVEARTLGGEKLRLERASDGSLRRFT